MKSEQRKDDDAMAMEDGITKEPLLLLNVCVCVCERETISMSICQVGFLILSCLKLFH